MHIIYLDEAGTQKEARHFVVGGLAVFERDTYFRARDLDAIQGKYLPGVPEMAPFHASALWEKNPAKVMPPFDRLTISQRNALIRDVYGVIADSQARVFAVAIEKTAVDGDPYERGFEEIFSRFDRMIGRISRESKQEQRGLIVVAESNYRNNLELLASKIAREGHQWGETRNIADIPYFAPARNTRLLQLADFVANSVLGYYEHGYATQFQRIALRIDQEPGRLHGLVHITRNRQNCYCPACVTRRAVSRSDADLL